MRRLLGLLAIGLLIPLVSSAQETESNQKRIVLFPFKLAQKGAAESFTNELVGALGAELSREGDISVLSGEPFAAAVKEQRVDPKRVARIIARIGADAAAWGTVTKLDEGFSMEVWVLSRTLPDKPRLFTTTGKDMEGLLKGMKDLAGDIGGAILNRPKVGEIKIEGNRRIQREVILNKLAMKSGSAFRRSAISDEIRDLYSMGYFDDVKINAEESASGSVDLHIFLKERPAINKIEITGNKVLSKDEILDRLTIKRFSVASLDKIHNDIEKIKKMYEAQGYYQPKIEYEIKDLSRNEANLIFKIEEGGKSYLTDIAFEGRKSLPEKALKKILDVKEKSWFWFLDESGVFSREKLEDARTKLIMYYLDHGFMNVQVGAPQMDIHNGKVKLTFPIREGERFQVRNVDVEGDLLVPKEKILASLKTESHTWVKRSTLAEDIHTLQKMYNNLGYAYVDVNPVQQPNTKYNFLDITYKIDKGPRVSIEKVDIAGNERTRDKIIRRSLEISEGDLYNADNFEGTKKNLEGMDFFEAVKLKTAQGSRPDLMNVVVEVLEKKTGSLAAGLGYSSQDGAMGNVDLKERNLFGMGIVANARANMSGRRNNYEASITYPWIFDYPFTGSVRGYQAAQKETQYVREGEGFSASLSFPVYGLWGATAGIARDSSQIGQIDRSYAYSISNYYRFYGLNFQRFLSTAENSVSIGLGRDTRDSSTIPKFGSKLSISSRFAGFGADVAYSRHQTEALYYHPLVWRAVLKLRGSGQMVMPASKQPIPLDRRLTLGGLNSIRGYQAGEVGPIDRFGNTLGGDRSLFANIECLVPLVPALNLNGVAFADAGNAWNASQTPFLTEVKAGVGVGVRWMSPMGPIRLEYGWKVNPRKGEAPGALGFAMGQLF